MAELLPWIADVLVILGLVVLTISIGGVLRMPDLFRSLHAASIATAFGVGPLLIAAGMQNGTILLRGLLVLGFMLLTSPVSAHAIARSYWRTESYGAASSTAATAAAQKQEAAPQVDEPERA
ncbi:MAG: monovalent cation/H(+) antiporter subunit G [Thermomicrobiales bacterium]|nr:monovalent cation/H(+) antiporter subunit G [Thermomicrobiales bacterium]